MSKIDDLIQKFQKDFGLTVDFKEVYGRRARFYKTASRFLGEKEKKIDEVDHYISVFRVLVDNYVENKAAPRTSYDLNVNQYDLDRCTNVITLAARYEEIIQAMHLRAFLYRLP